MAKFAFTLGPGPYKLEVEGNGLEHDLLCRRCSICDELPITIAGNLTENLQLPFHQLTVKTVDANGVVPDVKVGGGGFGYFSEDDPATELAPGVSAEEMDTSSTVTTNAEGEATLPIADFYSATATATPPEETGLPAQPFSVSNVDREGTRAKSS